VLTLNDAEFNLELYAELQLEELPCEFVVIVPTTSNAVDGVVVPIPTLPFSLKAILSAALYSLRSLEDSGI